MSTLNKKKILNDPVYGLINIADELIFDIIEHPYFQRLRRIKQLGLSHLVYPSAVHSRFSHAIGTMFLMGETLQHLQQKGHKISSEEILGAKIAILLHDVGHGPFSHALEYSIVRNISHEELSLEFMKSLNKEFNGKLSLAISIFNNDYHRHFLHQLVSSQLDLDRLDYLRRDSFFTGVSEGVIGTQRIIKMFELVNDKIVIEEKGIYSIENFLNSRRIMYWQVYLHKAVLSAEHLLMNILKRANHIANQDKSLFASPAFNFFLEKDLNHKEFMHEGIGLKNFSLLDDFDILSAIKVWAQTSTDFVLKDLSRRLINRNLFHIEFSKTKFSDSLINKKIEKYSNLNNLSKEESSYYIFTDHTSNHLYSNESGSIEIVSKDGTIKDIAKVSEQLSASKLKKPVTKYFLCYPKGF